MNAAEALLLIRYAKGMCPATAIDEYTPDAWAPELESVRFEDAKEAVRVHARKEAFIALKDILGGVQKIRGKRIRDFTEANPGALGAGGDPDDVAGYIENLRAQIRAIGDGVPAQAAIAAGDGRVRPVAELLDSMSRRHAIEASQ